MQHTNRKNRRPSQRRRGFTGAVTTGEVAACGFEGGCGSDCDIMSSATKVNGHAVGNLNRDAQRRLNFSSDRHFPSTESVFWDAVGKNDADQKGGVSPR